MLGGMGSFSVCVCVFVPILCLCGCTCVCVITVAAPYFSTGLIPHKVPFPLLMTHTAAAHFHGEVRRFLCHCVCFCVCVFSQMFTLAIIPASGSFGLWCNYCRMYCDVWMVNMYAEHSSRRGEIFMRVGVARIAWVTSLPLLRSLCVSLCVCEVKPVTLSDWVSSSVLGVYKYCRCHVPAVDLLSKLLYDVILAHL